MTLFHFGIVRCHRRPLMQNEWTLQLAANVHLQLAKLRKYWLYSCDYTHLQRFSRIPRFPTMVGD